MNLGTIAIAISIFALVMFLRELCFYLSARYRFSKMHRAQRERNKWSREFPIGLGRIER